MIDKNGKFLGKVNLIDLFVAIIVLAIIAVVAWRFANRTETVEVTPTPATITYTVEVTDVSQELYENILPYIPGDQLMASGAFVNGTVVAVEAEEQESLSISIDDEILSIPLESDDLLTLTFTIVAPVADDTTNEVGTQEVRIGRTHIVKTQHFEFSNGLITSCTWE